MPVSPLKLANTFICRYAEGVGGIDHMKLQKLDYFFHGWWLTFNDGHSALTEKPQVWKYGPVFPSLYNELKLYGSKPLLEPIRKNPFQEPEIIDDHISDQVQPSLLLDWVWNKYGHLSALALSDLTHRPGTAWRNVAEEKRFVVPMGFPLEDDKVKAEFDALKAEL